MTPYQASTVVFWGTIFLLFAYDFCMNWFFGPDATLSAVIVTTTAQYPIITFVLGVLAGHLFFPHGNYFHNN